MAKITRDIKRLQSGVDHWRTKTETRSKEWEASRASRIAERAELVRRYESAKSGVRALRDARATALRKMCVSSETAIKQLTETLEHARRALHAERLDAKLRQRLVAEDAAEDDLDERFSDSGIDSDADRANEPLDYVSRVLGRYYAAKTRRRVDARGEDVIRERTRGGARRRWVRAGRRWGGVGGRWVGGDSRGGVG